MEKGKKEKSNLMLYISIAVIVVFCGLIIIAAYQAPKEAPDITPYKMTYRGLTMHFRANLTEASKVSVYPDEQAVLDLMLRPDIIGENIAYVPNETNNPFYAVDAFEIALKVGIINKAVLPQDIKMNHLPVGSLEEAERLALTDAPIIFLSAYSDRTAVTVRDNMVLIEGRDMSREGRNYTDLDLATDQFLQILLEATNTQ